MKKIIVTAQEYCTEERLIPLILVKFYLIVPGKGKSFGPFGHARIKQVKKRRFSFKETPCSFASLQIEVTGNTYDFFFLQLVGNISEELSSNDKFF